MLSFVAPLSTKPANTIYALPAAFSRHIPPTSLSETWPLGKGGELRYPSAVASRHRKVSGRRCSQHEKGMHAINDQLRKRHTLSYSNGFYGWGTWFTLTKSLSWFLALKRMDLFSYNVWRLRRVSLSSRASHVIYASASGCCAKSRASVSRRIHSRYT